MDGFAYADIIFFALLAAYILSRLRNVLGHDDGTRISQGNPFIQSKVKEQAAKTVASPDKKKGLDRGELAPTNIEKVYEEPKITDENLLKEIEKIKAKDASFSLGHFLDGAQTAFEMVMEAYSNGDKETLKNLFDKKIYQNFEKEIDRREKAGEVFKSMLVEIISSKVKKISLEGNTEKITVKFKTEQINFVKNAEGKVIDGDASAVEIVEDTWTFARDVKSSDPNWEIISISG